MAYNWSNFSDSDTGEYHWTPNSSYDVVPFQDFPTYSNIEPSDPKLIAYYPTYEYSYNSSEIMCSGYDFPEPKLLDYYSNDSVVNYSMYKYSEPKIIEYDLSPYQSQYFISYNTIEFSEPDFVEYDPTPYDGGYDQTLTYGKPLPPSDQICYPRSSPQSNGSYPDGFSYNSIPSPYGNGSDDSSSVPVKETKPTVPSEEKQPDGDIETAIHSVDGNDDSSFEPIKETKPSGPSKEKLPDGDIESAIVERLEDTNHEGEIEGYNSGHDYPWYGYDYENGRIGEYGYGSDQRNVVAQTQYGYGSSDMDYCESIFGYWPCLHKKNKRGDELVQKESDKESTCDLWKGTEKFIFGTPLGYGEERGGHYGGGCESYYLKQPCSGQEVYYEEYDENSWIHKWSIF